MPARSTYRKLQWHQYLMDSITGGWPLRGPPHGVLPARLHRAAAEAPESDRRLTYPLPLL